MYPKAPQDATTKNKIVATVIKPENDAALLFMICNDAGPIV